MLDLVENKAKRTCAVDRGREIPKNDFRTGRLDRGRRSVIGLLTDLLLFSCLAAFTTGIVLAVANVLS